MVDVQPSKQEFSRLLGIDGDLATQIQQLQDQQGPGHELRVYTVPATVVQQPAPPQPVTDTAAAAAEGELPPLLPEAARLHPAISYDKTERILAKDAAVYLQDPAFEERYAIKEMPLKPLSGTLILFKGTVTADRNTTEDWRAHVYRWKQINGGKDVLITIHYNTHNIVTKDFPLQRGSPVFTMRSYKCSTRPNLTCYISWVTTQ